MTTLKSKLLYAVTWQDETGQTINLFKTLKQATEFLEAIGDVRIAKGKKNV